MVINWFRMPASNPWGTCWPLAAMLARALVTTWSRSLRLMVKPVPLAMTGSPNKVVIGSADGPLVEAGAMLAAAPEVAACEEITPATRAAERINFNFIGDWTFNVQFSSKNEFITLPLLRC